MTLIYTNQMTSVARLQTAREFIDFLEALQEMPWSWRNKTQGGEIALVPLTVKAK